MKSILTFLLLPLLVISQRNNSIPLNSSLTSSEIQPFVDSWRSPSGDFAFGFRKIEPNNDFLLSIWFDKIPDKTIVWYASIDESVPEGSKVTLTRDQGLVLTNPRGNQIWWSEFGVGDVSNGVLNDYGNFVLENGRYDEIWSSFTNPTDTLLPTQEMEEGQVLRSRQFETSFSKGKFRVKMQENGNLELDVVNIPTENSYGIYFSSDIAYATNPTETNTIFRLVYNESGDLYISMSNVTTFEVNKIDEVLSSGFYHSVIIHSDGVFAQYAYPKNQTNNGNWRMVWSKPDDICKDLTNHVGSGVCGFNNVCVFGESKRPSCRCPQGFSLIDRNNENGDCKPDFDLNFCNQTSYNNSNKFIQLQDVDWPFSDFEEYAAYNEDTCQAACLKDCFCTVAIFRADKCWKKKYPLSHGRQNMELNSKAFIKVPNSEYGRISCPTNNPTERKQVNHNGLVITSFTLLGISMLVNFMIIAFCRRVKTRYSLETKTKDVSSGGIDSNLRGFTYRELVVATDDFKEEVGRGAFGIVYRGDMTCGGKLVAIAVKKLDRVVTEGDKEFKNEVNVIGQTHHKNLVKLVGFCYEGQNRLLVYEFLPNGTLASFLFGYLKPSWIERTRIANGIAKGLLYLHEECDTQIIHCDIKPQNILLDEQYNARISDFGLAKLLLMNQSHTLTNIRGTKGYVAAEWFKNHPITAKVDVFSYGVLLLEIICCKKSVDLETNEILTYWAYDCFRQGKLIDLIEFDPEAIEDMENAERYIKVAIWCLQDDPGIRPNMRKVVQMLEGVVEVCDPPNPFPCFQ